MRIVAITIKENDWEVKCSKCGKEDSGILWQLLERGWWIPVFNNDQVCPECAKQ